VVQHVDELTLKRSMLPTARVSEDDAVWFVNHAAVCQVAAAHAAATVGFSCAESLHARLSALPWYNSGAQHAPRSLLLMCEALEVSHVVARELCERTRQLLRRKLGAVVVAHVLALDYTSKLSAVDRSVAVLSDELRVNHVALNVAFLRLQG